MIPVFQGGNGGEKRKKPGLRNDDPGFFVTMGNVIESVKKVAVGRKKERRNRCNLAL